MKKHKHDVEKHNKYVKLYSRLFHKLSNFTRTYFSPSNTAVSTLTHHTKSFLLKRLPIYRCSSLSSRSSIFKLIMYILSGTKHIYLIRSSIKVKQHNRLEQSVTETKLVFLKIYDYSYNLILEQIELMEKLILFE